MTVVIGIDPSYTSTGLAAVATDDLSLVWHCRAHKEFDLDEIAIDLERHNPVAAWIEDQYLKHMTRGTIKFVRAAGYWEGVCAMCGVEVEWIMAKTWQRSELQAGPRDKRADLKRRAIARCAALWEVELPSDVADAALIARYGAVKYRLHERINHALGTGCA